MPRGRGPVAETPAQRHDRYRAAPRPAIPRPPPAAPTRDSVRTVAAASRPGPDPLIVYFTRSRYWLVRVSTLTRSPTLMNSGTFTTAPVSSVAGFDPPAAVSPRTPGSVSVTSSAM